MIQQKLDAIIERICPSFDEANKIKHRNFMVCSFILFLFSFFLILKKKKIQKVETELIRAKVIAFRWPGATARCPDGSKLVGGGGN